MRKSLRTLAVLALGLALSLGMTACDPDEEEVNGGEVEQELQEEDDD